MRAHTPWEQSTVRFQETVYDKKRGALPTESSMIQAVRCVHQGRLGVAVSSSEQEERLLEIATQTAGMGPVVGDDFLAKIQQGLTPPSLQPEDVHAFVEGVHDLFSASVASFHYQIRHTRRELVMRGSSGETWSRMQDFVDYHVAYQQDAKSGLMRARGTTLDALLAPHDLLAQYPFATEAFPEARIDTGSYEMVFSPQAFELIVDMMLGYLNAEMQNHLQAPFRLYEGTEIVNECVTLDVLPSCAPETDDEGTAVTREPLIQNGVLQFFYRDRLTAHRQGQSSSGNGFRALRPTAPVAAGLPRTSCPYVRMEPGNHSLTQLVEGVTRGIFIEEFSMAFNQDFLFAPVRIPILQGWTIEKGRVQGRLSPSVVLLIELLPFLRQDLKRSAGTKQIKGRELPWIYAPRARVLSV